MEHLNRFVEEITLGFVDNPHTRRKERLTEKVTVCPACNSLHTLRHEGEVVLCTVCLWDTPAKKTTHAA
jgi:hypothetical protein